MKKAIMTGLLLIAGITSAHAEYFKVQINEDSVTWVTVFKYNPNDDGITSAWLKHLYENNQYYAEEAAYDCYKNSYKTLHTSRRFNHDETVAGEAIAYDNNWHKIVQGTINERIWKELCEYPIARRYR